jgi:aminoglycoside phosphotransferase family enzyme
VSRTGGTAAQGTAAQSVKDKFIAKMKGIDLEKLLLPYLQKDKITEEEIKQLEKDLEKFKPIAKQQLINQIKNQGRVTRATLTRKKQLNINKTVL